MSAPVPVVQDSADWHALRARHVGGSEIAALFDLPIEQRPAYLLSRFALWHIKAGHTPPPPVDKKRTAWGLRLEAVIAEAAAEEAGWTISKGGYVSDPTTPGLGCTLDYVILQPGPEEIALGFTGPGILEAKNVDWMVHKRTWTNDEPPPHILLQVQHQLAATGYTWGAIPGLVGGNDLKIYRYPARPRLIADIRRRVREFWTSIDAGQEPPVDGSTSASAVLASLYPEVVDDAIDMTTNNEWPEAAKDFQEAGAARKAADAAYDLAKNRVVELLAGHKRGWGGGWSVTTAITAAKADRAAEPGEIIKGRAETRRYTVKEIT
jgi:predicted phage-related endonuclease